VPASSGSEEDEQVRTSRAYNHSIYLMLIVPYGSLAVAGIFVYRHLRVRGAAQQRLLESLQNGVSPDDTTSPSGDRACSPPSPDVDS
jgi:hypothetical protein